MKTFYVDMKGTLCDYDRVPVEAETPQDAVANVFDVDGWESCVRFETRDNEIFEYQVFSQDTDHAQLLHTEIDAAELVRRAAPALLAAAEQYLALRPAFRFKPVGAPGSAARREQDEQIAAEDALRAAIKMAREA